MVATIGRSLVALAFIFSAEAGSPSGMSIACALKHCGGLLVKAAMDSNFRKSSMCEEGCNKVFETDTTPEKLHFQNCTTTCAVTYESPVGDKFLACAMNNECIHFAPIPGKCPFPQVDPDTSLASLEGEWWQHRGHNALWDCYDCQHVHAMHLVNDSEWCAQTVGPKGPVQAPCWSYTYSYDLYVVNGSTKYYGQTWQLPNVEKGKPIDIYYTYMGSLHNETWYLLKATDKYVLLVDCSYMMGWTNVGSIVWVRPGHNLTDTENSDIAKVYKEKVGWEYDDFCYDKHGPEHCDGPPLAERRAAPPSARVASSLAEARSSLTDAVLKELISKSTSDSTFVV